MDYMTKRATRYKTMAAQGVWSGRLAQIRGTECGWTLEMSHASHLTKEAAKEIAIEYLRDEYNAWGISFFIKAGSPSGKFFCKFFTNVL